MKKPNTWTPPPVIFGMPFSTTNKQLADRIEREIEDLKSVKPNYYGSAEYFHIEDDIAKYECILSQMCC